MKTLSRSGHAELLGLAVLLPIATCLRLLYLDSGMWLDEILTLVNYARLPYLDIVKLFDAENQHMLYSLLAHTSLLVFGESAWAMRLPAVLFGVGSIAALYFFGRKVSTPREAFLAAALLTFSYHHIWFSQNARGYSALLFWTILSSLFFIRALREEQPKLWLAFAISAALGVYTHITMVILVVSQFLIYLAVVVRRRRQNWQSGLRGIVLGFCLAAFLVLLLYAPVIPQIVGTIQGEHSVNGLDMARYLFFRFVAVITSVRGGLGGVIAILAAVLILSMGVLSYARSQPIVLGLLIFPAVLGTAIVLAANHYLYPRFFFFLVGFGALVGIRAVMELAKILAKQSILSRFAPIDIGTGILSVLILASALSTPLAYGPKQDYAGALDFIQSSRQSGDVIIAVGLAGIPYRDFYGTDWKLVTTREDLDAYRSDAGRTWVVYTITATSEAHWPLLMESIKHDFNLIKQFPGTLEDGTIFVLRSDPPSSRAQGRFHTYAVSRLKD